MSHKFLLKSSAIVIVVLLIVLFDYWRLPEGWAWELEDLNSLATALSVFYIALLIPS